MGGIPPLGYRAQDRKLVIVDSEAEIVRFIFRRYAELGSVRLLKNELEARSVQSKLRTSASGRISGGKPFARGALYLMLRNRIYRGEIVHNQQSHLGEHEPIIDQPLWDAVQAQLASNAAQRSDGGKTRQPSLLAGMLLDHDGNRMTPSHAVKRGTRYRYYVSGSLITKDRTEGSTRLRIPAAEIEQLVSSRVRRWLLDPGSIYKSTSAQLPDASMQQRACRAGRRHRQALARVASGTPADCPHRPHRTDRSEGRPDRHPSPPASAQRATRWCCCTIGGRERRRNPDPVRSSTPTPRRAGDQNGDRRDGFVFHRET